MNCIHIYLDSKISTSLDIFDEKITFISDEVIDDRINYGMLANREQKEKNAILGSRTI
jgi:hypothetical protein